MEVDVTEKKPKQILVGTDGSPDAQRALLYAARVALQSGHENARVRIVHAVDEAVLAGTWGVMYDLSGLEEAGNEILHAAMKIVQEAGVPADRIDAEVRLGRPAQVLVEASDGADLAVTGRRARSSIERLFVGSTSVALAASSHCPVIVLGQDQPSPTPPGAGVLVGVDPSGLSEQAIAFGHDWATRAEWGLTLLHVNRSQPSWLLGSMPSKEQSAAQSDAARGGVAALAERVGAQQAKIEVVQGDPADELIGRSADYGLLVLGAHRGNPNLVGGVIRGVLTHARCPVAVLPQG
ncbi:hypothetical protein CGZ92_02955 [Parenemella sanctibonifatiensis]|uniref:UspA domain-containing protein n=1 Tax=Parenemella sanctibonifatiensis TaxID=2016505 RepID=A0A255EIM4_9ACTN|nr:hypothetical protein CGZ92_02955 [Parenemella sanctibonifatiensis]